MAAAAVAVVRVAAAAVGDGSEGAAPAAVLDVNTVDLSPEVGQSVQLVPEEQQELEAQQHCQPKHSISMRVVLSPDTAS